MTIQKQKGISLSSLLIWSLILVLGAIFGMKLVPAYIEHATIKNHLTAIVQDTNLQNADPNQIRLTFNKRAQVDNIKTISGQDIKIKRESGRTILSTKYTTKIPLASNVSLSIDFEATTD
ncbi:MAG: DUF4845 domain-containing protein [Pseudomonadota bacterium]